MLASRPARPCLASIERPTHTAQTRVLDIARQMLVFELLFHSRVSCSVPGLLLQQRLAVCLVGCPTEVLFCTTPSFDLERDTTVDVLAFHHGSMHSSSSMQERFARQTTANSRNSTFFATVFEALHNSAGAFYSSTPVAPIQVLELVGEERARDSAASVCQRTLKPLLYNGGLLRFGQCSKGPESPTADLVSLLAEHGPTCSSGDWTRKRFLCSCLQKNKACIARVFEESKPQCPYSRSRHLLLHMRSSAVKRSFAV